MKNGCCVMQGAQDAVKNAGKGKFLENHVRGCCYAPARFPVVRPPGCGQGPPNWLGSHPLDTLPVSLSPTPFPSLRFLPAELPSLVPLMGLTAVGVLRRRRGCNLEECLQLLPQKPLAAFSHSPCSGVAAGPRRLTVGAASAGCISAGTAAACAPQCPALPAGRGPS
eukprot:633650-Rhodomonas_salina.1